MSSNNYFDEEWLRRAAQIEEECACDFDIGTQPCFVALPAFTDEEIQTIKNAVVALKSRGIKVMVGEYALTTSQLEIFQQLTGFIATRAAWKDEESECDEVR